MLQLLEIKHDSTLLLFYFISHLRIHTKYVKSGILGEFPFPCLVIYVQVMEEAWEVSLDVLETPLPDIVYKLHQKQASISLYILLITPLLMP